MGILNIDWVLNLFFYMLWISALCSAGIFLILVISPFLKKKHTVFWRYLLWIALAVRLVLPFDLSIPEKTVVLSVPEYAQIEERNVPHPLKENTLQKDDEQQKIAYAKEAEQAEYALEKENISTDNGNMKKMVTEEPNFLFFLAAVLWFSVAVLLFLWQIICYKIFYHRLKKTRNFLMKSGNERGNLPVYTSAAISSPILTGIWPPQIFLPCKEYEAEELDYILEHEFIHYRRKDLWIKLLLALARTLYWWNPFVALMERTAKKDMEFLCDSQVVKNFTKEEKKRYSKILLACAGAKNNKIFLCTSEFSKDVKTLKARFANIFSDKGKKKGMFMAAIGIGILCAISLFVAFGTSDKEPKDTIVAEAEKEGEEKTQKKQDDIVDTQSKPLEKNETEEKEPLKWSNYQKVLGKEYLWKDAEGWSYYLEEDIDGESPLREIADVLEPLLLTRYKNGERQILENLIDQENWRECPVLFVKDRIIYKAAPTADIIGVKDPVLVSIATDGSDRKTADNMLYHSFDGLCEDNGWIYYSGWTNDFDFPKPLCRIAPDFSGEPEFVEDIPGLLCGVKDGFVFYLANKEKKSGIWKRNLETKEEVIHDKWGVSAEEFTLFNVREREFAVGELRDEEISGCRIAFSYDYEGNFYTCDVPFY